MLHKMLWKNPNEVFGQPDTTSIAIDPEQSGPDQWFLYILSLFPTQDQPECSSYNHIRSLMTIYWKKKTFLNDKVLISMGLQESDKT